MRVGSELNIMSDEDTYQADALRLALSVSPNTFPCDTSLGLSLTRSSDLEILARCRVTDILGNLGFSKLSCEKCKVDKGALKLIISKSGDSDTVTEYTLS